MSSKPLNQPFFFEKTWKTRQFLSPTSLQEMIVLLENLSWTFIMSYPKTAPDISSSSTEKPNQMAKPIPETWKAWNEPNLFNFLGCFHVTHPKFFPQKPRPSKGYLQPQKYFCRILFQTALSWGVSASLFATSMAGSFRVFFRVFNRYYKSLTCMFRPFPFDSGPSPCNCSRNDPWRSMFAKDCRFWQGTSTDLHSMWAQMKNSVSLLFSTVHLKPLCQGRHIIHWSFSTKKSKKDINHDWASFTLLATTLIVLRALLIRFSQHGSRVWSRVERTNGCCSISGISSACKLS